MAFGIQTPSRRALQAVWQVPTAIALCALAVGVVGVRAELVGFLYIGVVTAVLCQADVTTHRLPNVLVFPGYAVTATGAVFGWLQTGRAPTVALIACCATFGFLLLLSLSGGMGMGDVKLGGLLALNLGALGAVTAIAGPVIGFVVGGIAGVIALVLPASGRIRRIPFGPYLLAGFWAASALTPFT